jgi:ribosomal protein L35
MKGFQYRQHKRLRGYSVKKHANQHVSPKELRRLAKVSVVTQGASVYNSNFSVNLNENEIGSQPKERD